MVKKWVYRILALALAVFMLFETRKYYITDVKAYAEAQAEQRAIWDAKGEIAKQLKEQQAQEQAEEKKDTTSATVEEEEEKEPEPVYEPSEATGDDFYFDFGQYALMESGEYLLDSGEKADQKRRLRYPELFEIDCPEYIVTITEGFSFVVCEYDAEGKYIRGIILSAGEKFCPCKEGRYFSVTLRKNEGEKSLSPGQWAGIMAGDFEAVICTEKRLGYTVSEIGNLIFPSKEVFSGSLSELLLASRDDELADVIWQKQIRNCVYTLSGEELDNGNVVYYVSSSEGDDSNTGLDIKHPKKTLDAFSGLVGVNVLLKCGDVFPVKNGIRIGKNSVFAAYGEGPRPVLDYYRDLDVEFVKDEDFDNLWVADLSETDIVTTNKNKENCNIGQLVIDGVINWKRYVWSSKVEFSKETLHNRGEGAWASDWNASKLYIVSTKNPNNVNIIYAPPVSAISVHKASNIVIKGLEIRGAGKHGINIESSKDVKVQCCYINHIGGSILVQAGSRYGNALQAWDSAQDVSFQNNYCSWIFDTCFTNQGSDSEAVCEDIKFAHNIGAHFFWGIETWGDAYSNNDFGRIDYCSNVLFDNVDITNPDTPMHSGSNTRLLGIPESEYVSYRTGYAYHQMSGINVSTKGTGEIENISDNIVWNSNRFLVLANNDRGEEVYSALKDNLLYAEVDSEKACLLRYTQDGVKHYCNTVEFLDDSNEWSVHVKSEGYDNTEEKRKMESLLLAISGGE